MTTDDSLPTNSPPSNRPLSRKTNLLIILFVMFLIVVLIGISYITAENKPPLSAETNSTVSNLSSKGLFLEPGESLDIPGSEKAYDGIIENIGGGKIYFNPCVQCEHTTHLSFGLSPNKTYIFPQPIIDGKKVHVEQLPDETIRVFLQ